MGEGMSIRQKARRDHISRRCRHKPWLTPRGDAKHLRVTSEYVFPNMRKDWTSNR